MISVLTTVNCCQYKHKYLGDILTAWPLRKVIIGSNLRPVTSEDMGFWPQLKLQSMKFPPVEKASDLIRKWLVTQWHWYLCRTTGTSCLSIEITSCRAHNYIRALMSFLLWKAESNPLAPWKLASREELCMPAWDGFPMYCSQNCVVSSAIESYNESMVNNQGQWVDWIVLETSWVFLTNIFYGLSRALYCNFHWVTHAFWE